jgi:predicted metalloprotease with PDZ domain
LQFRNHAVLNECNGDVLAERASFHVAFVQDAEATRSVRWPVDLAAVARMPNRTVIVARRTSTRTRATLRVTRLSSMIGCAALACTPAAHRNRLQEPLPELSYALSFAHDATGAPVIDVALTMHGTDDATVQLRSPARWAGQDSLFKSIGRVSAVGGGSIIPETDSTYRTRSAVTVGYELHQDWSGPLRYPLYHRAVVSDDYALFNTQNGLLLPNWPDTAHVSVHVSWHHLPADWTVITSYGDGIEQHATTTIEQLLNASFAAGRFRGGRSGGERHAGLDVRVGGRWQFSDSAFIQTVANIWSTERAFWGDTGSRFYSVVLLPLSSRGLVGGTAFTNGFVSFADTALALQSTALNLSHEIFHEWNGHQIVTAPPEEHYKWFSEGFTEYYADRMARAVGVLIESAYVDRVNAALRAYYLSPVHGNPLADIERRYWVDASANRYPYYQGYALALHLGQRRVDDLMHGLYRRARTRGQVTDSTLITAAAPDSRAELAAAIDTFIVHGTMIPMIAGTLPSCGRVEIDSLYAFDRRLRCVGVDPRPRRSRRPAGRTRGHGRRSRRHAAQELELAWRRRPHPRPATARRQFRSRDILLPAHRATATHAPIRGLRHLAQPRYERCAIVGSTRIARRAGT